MLAQQQPHRTPTTAKRRSRLITTPLAATPPDDAGVCLMELQRLRREHADVLAFARLIERRIGEIERVVIAPEDDGE